MSKITFSCWLNLHKMQLNNIEYQKGYEYAKRVAFFKGMSTVDLFEILRSYMDIGVKCRDAFAFGHAQAVRELIGERLCI